MEFRSVPSSEARVMQRSSEVAVRIKGEARKFIEGIDSIFNDKVAGGVDGFSVVLCDSLPAFATVNSTYGTGRFVFDWDLVGTELVGRLILERKRYDEHDDTFWQPVWGIYLTGYQGIRTSREPDSTATEGFNSSFNDDYRNAYFEAGLTIQLALVRGPLTPDVTQA